MKKTLIIFVAVALSVIIASAKVVRRTLNIYPSSVPETETLAEGTMEFVYDYKYCVDTLKELSNPYDGDRMLLQLAGDGLSKFSSLKNLTVDSLLMKSTQEQIAAAAMDGKLSNGEFMTIYKNYPQQGRQTHIEKICQDWLRYEEEMPAIDWELTDSVTTVLGYECRGARCRLGGRVWTAFYCEDIPVMEGPWKLCGLPGLIMKAEDSEGHYSFECIGIKSVASRPITMYKVPYNSTDRKGLFDTKHRYDVNPYAYYEATCGGHITVTDTEGNPQLDAYDPIDLPFEYIERDWR